MGEGSFLYPSYGSGDVLFSLPKLTNFGRAVESALQVGRNVVLRGRKGGAQIAELDNVLLFINQNVVGLNVSVKVSGFS